MTNSEKPKKLSFHIQELARQHGLPEQMGEPYVPDPSNMLVQKYFNDMREKDKIGNRPLSYDDLILRVRNSGYEIDDDNRKIVDQICFYFSGDPRMKTVGIDPNKGIALVGAPGVGKTWIMKLMVKNSHLPFMIAQCPQIADDCEQKGSEGISRLFNKTIPQQKNLYYGKDEIGICFNDLGREQIPVKYFGNPTNVMQKILFMRNEKDGLAFNQTHFTTNKSIGELDTLYEDFIRDRMRAMFNLIFFTSTKSRRK